LDHLWIDKFLGVQHFKTNPGDFPMTILVTGATGRVGRHVVQQLANARRQGAHLVRDPSKADFPAGVEVVQGDLLDIDALRSAFAGVNTLFLLNAVAATNSPRRSLP
jgi:uncharacterized protein YbjT (DUF2867 family)